MNQEEIKTEMLGQNCNWKQKGIVLLGLAVQRQNGYVFFRPDDPVLLSQVAEATKEGTFTGFIGVQVHHDGSVVPHDRLLYDDAFLLCHEEGLFSSAKKWLDIVTQRVTARPDVQAEIEQIRKRVP